MYIYIYTYIYIVCINVLNIHTFIHTYVHTYAWIHIHIFMNNRSSITYEEFKEHRNLYYKNDRLINHEKYEENKVYTCVYIYIYMYVCVY
jgi:hypothetical protein